MATESRALAVTMNRSVLAQSAVHSVRAAYEPGIDCGDDMRYVRAGQKSGSERCGDCSPAYSGVDHPCGSSPVC